MPAVNRVVCLLSNPLAAQRGVEGRLVELPIIDTESEATNLQEALREGSEDTGLEVELQMRYATVDALRSSMTLGAKILHFAGHGHPDFLCFEDGRGAAVALSPEALRALVSAGGHGVRLVVVNSCHSEAAGRAFVGAGVPHVVAVSAAQNAGRVSDRAATSFCKAFYLGIIAGRTVKQAFDIGCAAASNGATPPIFVLLPEGEAHDERVFCENAPRGGLLVTTTPRTPSNAPPAPTWYIGRTSDLAGCVDSLLRHRLTTITGAFGSGKSALAAAAAQYVAGRNHFEAVCWLKARSRDTLFDDVLEAATAILGDLDEPFGTPRLLRRNSSRYGHDDDDRSSLLDRRSSLASVVDDPGLLSSLRERKVLIVVDDFERLLLAMPRHELLVRAQCQKLLADLLSTASKAHIILTTSSGPLGHVLAVTERVVKLSPLEPAPAAKLLLQRSPELSRRAYGATRAPRVAPADLVRDAAAHPVIDALSGIPFAISLSSSLLNLLFECEDKARAAIAAARSEPPSPPTPAAPLEPLDRLLRVLKSKGFDSGAEITRLRDEIRFVIEKGSEFEAPEEDETEFDARPAAPPPTDEPRRPLLRSPWPAVAPRHVARALGAVWVTRLLVDAWLDPPRAFSLRLDAVVHAALDIAAVILLYDLS